MHSVRLISVAMAALTLAATTLATPAAAVQAPPDYGSTYACRYQPMRGTMYAALKRIAVAPPIVYGDEANQTVGWRVIIRRDRFVDNSDLGKTTYWRSAIHKAVASPGQAADFSKIVYMAPPPRGEVGLRPLHGLDQVDLVQRRRDRQPQHHSRVRVLVHVRPRQALVASLRSHL